MKIRTILLLSTALFFFACCNKNNRQDALDNISKFEDSIDIANNIISVENGSKLIDLYTAFAKQFPNDSLAPAYWFRSAEVAASIHRPDLAIQFLDTVINNYPNYEHFATCHFYKGFVLENVARDLENARLAYQEFIDKFPNDPMVNDARISIENLGLTPEEMLEKILSQNPDAQNEVAEKQ